jgi:hypothetical protein
MVSSSVNKAMCLCIVSSTSELWYHQEPAAEKVRLRPKQAPRLRQGSRKTAHENERCKNALHRASQAHRRNPRKGMLSKIHPSARRHQLSICATARDAGAPPRHGAGQPRRFVLSDRRSPDAPQRAAVRRRSGVQLFSGKWVPVQRRTPRCGAPRPGHESSQAGAKRAHLPSGAKRKTFAPMTVTRCERGSRLRVISCPSGRIRSGCRVSESV